MTGASPELTLLADTKVIASFSSAILSRMHHPVRKFWTNS
jgi:hypothetical protein